VNLGFDVELARAEALRCLQCPKPPCVPACPVEVKVKEFVDPVLEGDWLGAAAKVREDNVLPAITGWVCPQEEQCEGGCLVGRKSKSIAIGHLERFVRETSAHLAELTKVGFRALESEARPADGRDSTLRAGALVPDATLSDQSGRRRRLSEWRGRVVALTFIFTRCPLPEFCPAMDRRFREVQSHVKADAALRDHVALLSISFDPDFDTPAVLRAHAARLEADPSVWLFLTGAKPDVEDLGRSFGLAVFRKRRELLLGLSQCSAEAITEYIRMGADKRPGIVVSIATAGDMLQCGSSASGCWRGLSTSTPSRGSWPPSSSPGGIRASQRTWESRSRPRTRKLSNTSPGMW
jgi:cytochrome oxidase Cu insertion factor (SCO1/SenC/PrrC family)